MTSPYPLVLIEHVARGEWERAIMLCRCLTSRHHRRHVTHTRLVTLTLLRHIKEPMVWAVLATMAIAEKELNTAEVAFAAVDMVSHV